VFKGNSIERAQVEKFLNAISPKKSRKNAAVHDQIISLQVRKKSAIKNELSCSEPSEVVNQPVPDELDYRITRSPESCEDLTIEKAISVNN
jgi:hypothetical protein